MNTTWKPELDGSRFCNVVEHRFYMQLVGIFLWIVHLGRVDIAFAVSSLSRFSVMSRIQHLVEFCKIWGYLTKFSDKNWM